MSDYKIKLVPRSNVVLETSYRDRYYFTPGISGYTFTEANTSGEYFVDSVGHLYIHHDGHPITFPKIRTGSGGIKLAGSGLESGTQFFNNLATSSLIISKPLIKSSIIIENFSQIKYVFVPGSPEVLITDFYNGGTYLGTGGINVSLIVSNVFPKNVVGTGGIKLSGSGSLGSVFFDDLANATNIRPFTHTLVSPFVFYGQTHLRDSIGYVLPEVGLFSGEDIEGHPGLKIGGTATYYMLEQHMYEMVGGFKISGTTDINKSSNKHIQLPYISGRITLEVDFTIIYIRKYSYTGLGSVYITGPNNIYDDLVANFTGNSYLKRSVPGEVSSTGSGALFWAWDDILKLPKGTNFLIRDVVDKKFGSNATKFTLFTRFKLDSKLEFNVSVNDHLILISKIITDGYLDFTDFTSISYLGLLGYSKIIFFSEGTGYNQHVQWESSNIAFAFDTEYRLLLQYDSNQVIDSDRIKVYLNGNLISPVITSITYPSLGSDGYSNVLTDYSYYSSIGGSYLTLDSSVYRQFLGVIFESVFLDDLIKTDIEFYPTSYSGPYPTKYSYHLKYEEVLNLGKDYSNNSNTFQNAPIIEEINTFYPIYYKDEPDGAYVPYPLPVIRYDNLVTEPVEHYALNSLVSYLNDKKFTLNLDIFIPDCIRNCFNFDQWSTFYKNTLGTQSLRSISSIYDLTHPTRFSFGCRFFIDSRYEYKFDYTESNPLVLFSITKVYEDNGNYLAGGCFKVYLENSGKYDGREVKTSGYIGTSLHIEGVGNCDICVPPKFIQVNKNYRLVIHVDTNAQNYYDRIKVILNDQQINQEDILYRGISMVESPPLSGTYISVVNYGYPLKGENVYGLEEFNYSYPSIYEYLGSFISIGGDPFIGLTDISANYSSFIGTISDIILIDGRIVDSSILLPISGYYSDSYGSDKGTFHYKLTSGIYSDSGPNNYELDDIGSTAITSSSMHDNKNKSLFVIQDTEGYIQSSNQYYRFGFNDSSTKYYLGYEAIGSITASAFVSTELNVGTWNRIQISVDTSLAVPQDRVKFYLNKNLLTYSGGSHIPQNTNLYSGSGILYSPYTLLGNRLNYNNTEYNQGFTGIFKSPVIYLDGFVVEPEFFDQLTPPIPYGAYGFKLDFSDLDNLGYDSASAKYNFDNEGVFNVIEYESNYDWGRSVGFEIYRDTTPIQDINLLFKLISSETVELELVFNITLDPLVAILPFKLIGSGIEVELILPFILTWTSNFDSGTHTNTEIIITIPNTPIPVTFENISGTVITDITNTIFYEFGTSASDPNALNGWINQSTGEIIIFDLDTQLNNGASNVINEGSNVNANYDYNLAQSLLIWSMSCSIGQLVGEISVEYEEDASTVAKFTILPESGEIDPLEYIGKSVSLSVTFSDSKGGSYSGSGGKIFTGVVSEVEWDADLRVLNVTADTQMPAYFNSLSREEIDSVVGGIWSSQVWDNEDDSTGWTYAQERLGTTENTIWHDRNGTLRINSFKASGSSITFTDNERFHETLKLEFAQRSEMVNQIRIDLSYSYPRRREAKTQFKWTDPSNGQIQTFLCGGNSYQLCQRSMVEGAATGGSWVPISQITYDPIWPAQVVSCGGGMYDFIVWGFQLNNIYTPVKTDTGEWQKVNLIDLNTGKLNTSTNKMEYTSTPGDPTESWNQESLVPPEVTNALCIGAHWTAARRWIQSVSEEYEIIMQCQDSIDTIGVVASTESYSIDSGIEDDEWENSLTPYKYTPPSGSLSIPGSGDPYWNLDDTSELEDVVTREDFALAQEVIMAAAKTDILKAHRLTTVSFQVPYQSGVDLSQTITVDTPYLSATGKLRMIKHQFSIDTGEASTELFMAISRHNGNGLYQDDPLEPLERPEPATEEPIDSSIKLGNYVGGRTWGNQGFTGRWEDGRADGEEDPENEGEWLKEPWEGFMTNYESPLSSNDWNSYMSLPSNLVPEAAFKARLDVAAYTIPYQFIVRGPDIDETHTNASETQASQVYNVNIPVDYLRISA